MLESAYELLRTTPPFRNWRLPEPDDVSFRVIATEADRGAFRIVRGIPTIYISRGTIGRLSSLLKTMAHEMVHLHEETAHSAREDVVHSKTWVTLAARVCHHHEFDEKLF